MPDVSPRIEKSGTTLLAVAPLFGSELPIYGVIALSQGALLVSMVWAATLACALDRKFLPAAAWMAAGAVLSFFGVIHAARLTGQGVENDIRVFAAPAFALSYGAAALLLVGFHFYSVKPRFSR